MEQTLQDKTILITGATGGIGFIAARSLAGMGATVAIVGRDAARTEARAQEIRRTTGNYRVTALIADLSEMAQVRELAEQVRRTYPRLDVLLNNAGALFMSRNITREGFERTFALNHLAPFLLTNLLLGALKSNAPARIVTVASVAHIGAHVDFGDVNRAARAYHAMGAYSDSKLANIMFTYALARRLEGTGVTANCLHPGFVATGFAKNNGGMSRIGMSLLRPFAISPERGAQTSVYLASSPKVAGVSGKYFANKRPVQSSSVSYDVAAQERLWALSEQMTGLANPLKAVKA